MKMNSVIIKAWNRRVLVVFIVIMLLLQAGTALADIAPPYQPPGSNLQPGSESTQVRMMAETVTIEVGPGGGDSLGTAQVTADFTMLNLGGEAENLAVRFPISANDGRSNYPEIKNLQVKVNGNNVRTRRIEGEDPLYGGDMVPWAEFEVSFPPDEDVDVRVSYTLEGTGYAPFVSFQYILSTGAAWKDTIGSADLIVRLPYEANPYNVILDQQIGWSQTTSGGVIDGNEVRWHYENLEPGYEHNLDIALVMPAVWQKILNERANVEKNPEDGEAWGRLGKLYKEIAFLSRETRADPAGTDLYQMSIAAYEECLRLKPNDADWHAGFAELFWLHFSVTQWSDPKDYSDLTRSLELLKRAIEINPRTPKALEMLESFEWDKYVVRQGESYDFLLLTATPTARITATRPVLSTPTANPQATDTPSAILPVETPLILDAAPASPTASAADVQAAPTVTPASTRTEPPPATEIPQAAASEPRPGGSLCGAGALVLPFGLAAALFSKREKIIRNTST